MLAISCASKPPIFCSAALANNINQQRGIRKLKPALAINWGTLRLEQDDSSGVGWATQKVGQGSGHTKREGGCEGGDGSAGGTGAVGDKPRKKHGGKYPPDRTLSMLMQQGISIDIRSVHLIFVIRSVHFVFFVCCTHTRTHVHTHNKHTISTH